MVTVWPPTASQRSRTIQRRLIRATGSTETNAIQAALVPKIASQIGKVMLKLLRVMRRGS